MRLFPKLFGFGILTSALLLSAANARTDTLSAGFVLQKMAQAYVAIASYSDHGVVSTYLKNGEPPSKTTFQISYSRPDLFRFDMTNNVGSPPLTENHKILWCDRHQSFSWWQPVWQAPAKITTNTSVFMGISGFTGISSRSVHNIPSLLQTNLGWQEYLCDLSSPEILGDEMFDQVDCYRIRGGGRGGRSFEIWLGKSDFLIRKIKTTYSQGQSDEEIHQDITINQPISLDTFDPSSPDSIENAAKTPATLISTSFSSRTFLGQRDASTPAKSDADFRGNQFIGFSNFSSFDKTNSDTPSEIVLSSPELSAAIHFDQLIASWNADLPEDAYLKVEARAIYPDHTTKYYTMGLWSRDPARHPRESVPHQKDADGDVSTDTLILKLPCDRIQLRLTLGGDGDQKPKLKFLGISLADTKTEQTNLPPSQAAWGKTIPVPERSQMAYPNGGVLCSPTTVSMLMTYWSHTLNRPELDHDVPEIVKEIYDSKWHGTGNWPFNMAYPGSFTGMRAYVSRFSNISELEDWIAAGLPVGLSVCYDRLRGKGPGPNGHLVVCVGFTKDGDVIINDPGTSKNVRKTFPRKNLIYAWANSHNVVYLIYPENAQLPVDRFGHWDSSLPNLAH